MRVYWRLKASSGQALVEITIATLVAAMTTMSVFSVILSANVSQGKADKREAAALSLKYAQEVLKSYVSADPFNSNIVPGLASARPGAPVGPTGTTGRWKYDSSGAWALAAGNHDVSGLLDGTPLKPAGAVCSCNSVCGLCYSVADYDCGFGSGQVGNPAGNITGNTSCKMVVFTLTYPD